MKRRKGYDDLVCPTLQVQAIVELLTPSILRRQRAEVEQPVPARAEVQVPVTMTEDQAECYRKVLGRFYDILADPKMHRLSSTRASQSKIICDELRKVPRRCFPAPWSSTRRATPDFLCLQHAGDVLVGV